MMKKWFWIPVLLIGLWGCEDSNAEEQKERDEKIITQYIQDNNLNAKKGEDGLYYVINTQGTGRTPGRNSRVGVRYKGYLTNGTVFDESTQEAIFELSKVIKGWQIGIPYFKEGGRGTLLIPSHLGYGDRSTDDIPSNSVLLFDVELTVVF